VAPKKGRYENLEAELCHDIGVIETKLEAQEDVQSEHGKMLGDILGKLSKKEELCAGRHDEFFEEEISPAIEGATGPVEVIKRWGANPLVWAVLIMAGLIIGAAEEWLRYTWNVSNDTRTRVKVIEKTIEQIPPQMKAQNAKIDKILTQIRKNNGHNP
jgi:hypothetical protein